MCPCSVGPSSVSGSGELLLMCVLALLGPSSASLYSDSDSVVLGSESGSQNVPCRGTVVSGAQNVPCLDRAVVCLRLLTQGQQGRVLFVSGEGYHETFGFQVLTSVVIQRFVVLGARTFVTTSSNVMTEPCTRVRY